MFVRNWTLFVINSNIVAIAFQFDDALAMDINGKNRNATWVTTGNIGIRLVRSSNRNVQFRDETSEYSESNSPYEFDDWKMESTSFLVDQVGRTSKTRKIDMHPIEFSGNLLSYIGPGAGMGLLLSLLGLVAAVGGALFTVVLWPIRKMMKKKKMAKSAK